MSKTLVSDRLKGVKIIYSRLLSFRFGPNSHGAVNYCEDVTNKQKKIVLYMSSVRRT